MIRTASNVAAAAALAWALAPPIAAHAQTPAPAAAAPAAAPAPQCVDCGVVTVVNFVQEKGKTSGVGAVAGGVLGGVIGHQIGGGTGQTVATIAGAGGGAYVGNKVEQNRNTKAYWSVGVRMDGGQQRTFVYSNQPTVKQGDRVKLIDGGKRLALVAN